MTERDAIIEAMARVICAAEGFNPFSTETNDEPYWMTWREHATAALDAALPMLADEAFRWDTGRLAAEALRSLQEPSK